MALVLLRCTLCVLAEEKMLTALNAFLKDNKKSLIGVLSALLAGGGITGASDVVKTVNTNKHAIQNLSEDYARVEEHLIRIDEQIDLTVKQTTWLAYLRRRDDEYHAQQAVNHQLFQLVGQLTGSQTEDEKFDSQFITKAINPKSTQPTEN